eukprot:g7778.t1
MSPAMRQRRVSASLASLASLEEVAGAEGGNNSGNSGRTLGAQKGAASSSYDRLSEASSSRGGAGGGGIFYDSDDAGSDGGSRRTRQRSSTWDEHGIAKQQEERKKTAATAMMGRTSVDGAGGRARTWSHNGALGRFNGQLPRPSAEWAHLDAFQAMGSMFQQELYHEKSSGLAEVLFDRMRFPLLIILVGVLAALAGMTVDFLSGSARMWRINWTAAHQDMPFEWAVYASTSLALTLGMCAITHFICPCASGGGVPEMKAVLSGASRPGLLSARLVIVKMTGVVVANAAGLSVGKEGPLIHVTCAMADILMSTPWFKKVRLNNMKRLELLACACAAGVAATFGSVFGGTLFSVEVTATAYMVETLPATFFCAVVVAVVFWASGQSELFNLISDNTAQALGFTGTDLWAWAVLGAVCGLVGAGFVAVLDALSKRRNFFTRKDLPPSTRKMRMFVVVALATLMVIPASFTEAVAFNIARRKGRAKYHPLVDRIYDQTEFGMSWHLVQLLLLKSWTTIFSVVQPLPVGLFSPVFVIGGLMGRIFGEIADWMDRRMDSVTINFQPWEFALIGSAAFSAGVTRAVSTAVIVFELSGENHLRLPLGVALMISYFIANRFTKGIYDALMDTNGTPHLEEVPPEDRNAPAEDLMIPVEDIPCLSLDCTGRDASRVASLCQPGQVIPVVQSMADKVLVGVVLWNDLAIALADYRRRGSSIININTIAPKGAARGSGSGSGASLLSRRSSSRGGSGGGGGGGGGQSSGPSVAGIGSPETAAAAAAATGERFEWEDGSDGEPAGAGAMGISASGAWWPGLADIAEAVGRRVRWFPRVRTAEASLLRVLDKQRAGTDDEEQTGTSAGGDGGAGRGHGMSDDTSPLPPLGEGIPWGATTLSGGDGDGAHGVESLPLLRPDQAGQAKKLFPSASSALGEDTHDRPTPPQQQQQQQPGRFAPAEPAAAEDARGNDAAAVSPPLPPPTVAGGRTSRTQAVPLTAIEKAKRAPLRFYLVREGNKFIPVGRRRSKGGWRELPEMLAPAASGDGIPVVLDPSPYQVTHTTELSKVDIAFRLLRLDNAYVCNAGRLVGVITRDSLADFVDQREVSPMDDCVRLCGAFACCFPGAALGAAGDGVAGDNAAVRHGSRTKKPGSTTGAVADGTLRFRNVAIGGAGGRGSAAARAARPATARSSLLDGVGSAGNGGASAATRQGYSALGETESIVSGGRGVGKEVGEWDPV